MYKYVSVVSPGGPKSLEIKSADIPVPKADEVRIKVETAGVAFPDVLIRTGTFVSPDIYPLIPGYDAVGRVDKLGEEVKGIRLGQRVLRVSEEGEGGYAEYLCNPASELVSVPDAVESAAAVSVGLNGVMAYQMVHRLSRIVNGESILVHGAAGGIGHLIVQLGKLIGATVYGTGSTSKQETIKSLGAVPIDYQREDFEERIRELTGEGVDVVFDNIGPKEHWQKSYDSLRITGRLVIFGTMGAILKGVPDEEIIKEHRANPKSWSVGDLFAGNKLVTAYALYLMKAKHPEWFREDLFTMLDLVARKKIAPIIGARFRLEDVQRAHEILDAAAVPGKIVLEIQA